MPEEAQRVFLTCSRHGRQGREPESAREWLGARGHDLHALAWRVFFAALRLPAEYRVEHLRIAFVWQGDAPDTCCREVAWYWLPSLGSGWLTIPGEEGAWQMEWMVARALARHLRVPLYVATMPPGVHPRVSSCRHCLMLPADYRGHYLAPPDEGPEHDFPDDCGRLWRWCSRCGPVCIRPDALCHCGEQPDPASFHASRLCFAGQMVRFALRETAARWGLKTLSPSWRRVLAPHLEAARAAR